MCAQGTNVAPGFMICLDSGQVILIAIAIVLMCLFSMAVGAGMRKK